VLPVLKKRGKWGDEEEEALIVSSYYSSQMVLHELEMGRCSVGAEVVRRTGYDDVKI
jgi:hypothetical protein